MIRIGFWLNPFVIIMMLHPKNAFIAFLKLSFFISLSFAPQLSPFLIALNNYVAKYPIFQALIDHRPHLIIAPAIKIYS